MNYFSHYFFDHKVGDSYFNTGLILPDFSRSAVGTRKLRLDAVNDSNEVFRSLKMGCERHYLADDWFHASAFFLEGEAIIKADLKQYAAEFSGQRIWFVSHILVELLLDRILIAFDEKKLLDFYADLEAVDLNAIILFLQECGKTGFADFENYFHSFVKNRYLITYLDDDKLLYALNRILLRTKQEKLTQVGEQILSDRLNSWQIFLSQTKKPTQMHRLFK
jgi:hypothetical protein